MFVPSPIKVGIRANLSVSSTPAPNSARVGGLPALLRDDSIEFTPRFPGATSIEFEYVQSGPGKPSEWREVSVIDVQPAVAVDLPYATSASKDLDILIRQIETAFYGLPLALVVGGQVRDTWAASPDPHAWVGSVDQTDEILEVAVVLPEREWTLWRGSVHVYAGFALNRNASLPVTTTDGALKARLEWVALGDERIRGAIESAFANCGFILHGWSDNNLRISGTTATCGYRDVTIRDRDRKVDVRILTLADIQLRLDMPGPIELGKTATVFTASGELLEGLYEIDGGPLSIDVYRIDPPLDGLSVRTIGNRLHFYHPGQYSIALVAGSERLAEVNAEVRLGMTPSLGEATAHRDANFSTAYDASVYGSELSALTRTVVVSQRRSYRVLQDSASAMNESIWSFVLERHDAGEKVLVSWPGLSFGAAAADLLLRLRQERRSISVAHLSYPAPRGEVVADESAARSLRRYRVLCCARANSAIDRQDLYICPVCNARPLLQTSNSRMWIQCGKCGYTDQDVVLTLSDLRSGDVQVLFADFRIAKYLSRGRGTRYAGSFGRSVRCGNCHSLQPMFSKPGPWDKAELQRLITAFVTAWDSTNPSGSIRRAAQNACKRAPRSRPGDVTRLEDALYRLIEGNVLQDGRCVGSLDGIKAGLSVCCNAPLLWSHYQVAYF